MPQWNKRRLAPAKPVRCRSCGGRLDGQGRCAWCAYKDRGKSPGSKGKENRRKKSVVTWARKEYERILQDQQKRGLKPLTLGSEKQTVFGTMVRWKYVIKGLHRLQGQQNAPDMRAKFLAEVNRHEMAPWWMDERERLEQHFGHLLPSRSSTRTVEGSEVTDEE